MRRKGGDSVPQVILVGYEEEENLGLGYIAAYLKAAGATVEIVTCRGPGDGRLPEALRSRAPRIVGFSLLFQSRIFEFASLIEGLRSAGIVSHFTMGGHFPTHEPSLTLEAVPGLDSVIRHEGEVTLLDLLQHVDRRECWHEIPGLVFRDGGRIVHNAPRPLIRDLDSLPFPERQGVSTFFRGLGAATLVASRGCLYDCSFCSIQGFYAEPDGPPRRTRSPANVAEEMERLYDEAGVRIFSFKDDDLPTKSGRDRRWIEDFARELSDRGLAGNILWRISCRVDDVDHDLMKRLQDVGLTCLYLGIETGSERGLKTFHKRSTMGDTYRALEVLDRLAMPFEYGFMLFDPDSSLGSIRENVEFLRRMCVDGAVPVHFSKMFPYAGTPIARRLGEEKRLEGPLDRPDYRYPDGRVNFLQWAVIRCFGHLFFSRDGLLSAIQSSRFDAVVARELTPRKCDWRGYLGDLRAITKDYNDYVLEVLSMNLRFLEERDEDSIAGDWAFMPYPEGDERTESRLWSGLERTMARYREAGRAAQSR